MTVEIPPCAGCQSPLCPDCTSDPECALSELPASQCACPKHRGGATPGGEPIETVGQTFEAWYPGVCVRCEGRIRPGQTIARAATDVDPADYVHAVECPR